MSEQNNSRIIEFPKINWAELKKGSLPKGEVAGKIRDALKSLIEVQMLKVTNFLSKDTLDKADEINDQLEELKNQYPQLIGVTQNLLGQQIKDLAEKKGDSQTLFDRLRILAIEAIFQGTLQKWDERDLGRVPMGLRQNFMVQIFNPKTRETIYLLPRNWRNPVHKRIALILRDLSFKARETYKAEKEGKAASIATPKSETSAKPQAPAEPETSQTPEPPADLNKSKPKRAEKSKPEQTPEDRAGKRAKASKAKALKEEDENEIKKVKSLADLDLLRK